MNKVTIERESQMRRRIHVRRRIRDRERDFLHK
jgi:hypothetical protein